MNNSRYGHMSCLLSGYLIVCGGFEHIDHEQSIPQTLTSTEMYNIQQDLWV